MCDQVSGKRKDGEGDQIRKKAAEDLRRGILEKHENRDALLWQAVLAYQGYPFYTSSGLPFSYVVKRKKNGEYSGEMIVSRKEDSKTLTKSSVFLAFRRILERMDEGGMRDLGIFVPVKCKGPKAIGQIFGISYIYSLFWRLGLIEVPETVEKKLGNCL